eukprot:TRINITY_DN20315_c0_g1_i1.p1 TRINITY_DN20315_c0_g1~~TRINITY_DN20315_c0_g1_i1.p1  ORF type:complete len:375 (+),score=56.02 TRINITY_DN20315_c0_g1_i1:53-1177(+)
MGNRVDSHKYLDGFTILSLPEDATVQILQCLEGQCLYNASQVCHPWRRMVLEIAQTRANQLHYPKPSHHSTRAWLIELGIINKLHHTAPTKCFNIGVDLKSISHIQKEGKQLFLMGEKEGYKILVFCVEENCFRQEPMAVIELSGDRLVNKLVIENGQLFVSTGNIQWWNFNKNYLKCTFQVGEAFLNFHVMPSFVIGLTASSKLCYWRKTGKLLGSTDTEYSWIDGTTEVLAAITRRRFDIIEIVNDKMNIKWSVDVNSYLTPFSVRLIRGYLLIQEDGMIECYQLNKKTKIKFDAGYDSILQINDMLQIVEDKLVVTNTGKACIFDLNGSLVSVVKEAGIYNSTNLFFSLSCHLFRLYRIGPSWTLPVDCCD